MILSLKPQNHKKYKLLIKQKNNQQNQKTKVKNKNLEMMKMNSQNQEKKKNLKMFQMKKMFNLKETMVLLMPQLILKVYAKKDSG